MMKLSSAKFSVVPTTFSRAIIFSFLLASYLPFTARAQDDDVIRVNTDLVVMNVTVTDVRGAYVHGLKESDFKVYEDSQQQIIASFSVEETPFAAAILLDTSGSMEGRMSLARAAAIRFLEGLRSDDVAAVYRFDSRVEQVQDFSASRDLAPVAYNLRANGQTSLNDAVARAARDLSRREEKRRAIIVLSDGADTHSALTQDKALAAALAAGATVYTVDMYDPQISIDRRQPATAALRNFASKSGGRYVASPGGQAMRDAFTGIMSELSNQYTVGYQPSNRARDGRWRTIKVQLSQNSHTVRTRSGYRAPKS
ncbi:MAG: VWA domain-containing protein [Pyrinomonadaceae bacterium]